MELSIESVIRGHHIFKSIWTPFIWEILPPKVEVGNVHDNQAVAVSKNDNTVGHVPQQLSKVFFFLPMVELSMLK